QCPKVREHDETDSALDRASIDALVYAKRWERTLREAVVGPRHVIMMDEKIRVYEEQDREGKIPKKTTREWAKAMVAAVGEKELRRWAHAVGGDVGMKVRVLITVLNGGGVVTEGGERR